MGRCSPAYAIFVLSTGCALSHELDALDDASTRAPRDAAIVATDAGTPVETCGGTTHTLTGPGCTTFTLPPTGTTTCRAPGGRTVTGPSFVAAVPPGMSMMVDVATDDPGFQEGVGAASEPCDECSTSFGAGPGGVRDFFTPDAPMRYVLRSTRDPAGFHVTVCTPGLPR